jgi:hypothetical protein
MRKHRLIACFGLALALASCENTSAPVRAVPQYTVTFQTGGGSAIADKTVRKGTALNLEFSEYQSERDGFFLDGWFLSTDTTETLITSITVTEDITLVAVWIDPVSVTLDMQGGELLRDPDSEILPLPGSSMRPGDIFDASLYVPIRKGYIFRYWYLEDDPFQPVESIQVNYDITLVAMWIPGWIVTFMLDGATLHEGDSVTVVKGSKLDLTTIKPVKKDHVLEGWYYYEDFTDRVPSEITVIRNITLYAKWLPLSYFEPLFGVWAGSANTSYLLYHDPDGSSLTGGGLTGFYFSLDGIRSFVWTAAGIDGKTWSRTDGTLTVGTDTFTAADTMRPAGNRSFSKLWVKEEKDVITVSLNLFDNGNGALEANDRVIWISYNYSFIYETLYLLRHNTDEDDQPLPGEILLAVPVVDGKLSGFEEKEFDGEGGGGGVL